MNKKTFKHSLIILLALMLGMVSCQKEQPQVVTPLPSAAAQFYVLNEGQYGKTPAGFNYYNKGKWTLNLFQTANPDKTLGITGVNAVFDNGKVYTISKQKVLLSQADAATFKEIARIEDKNNPIGVNGQAYNFCVANAQKGVLTTNQRAYEVNLSPLSIGKPLSHIDPAYCGDITKVGEYVFLINNGKLKVYKAADLSFIKELGEAVSGFVQSKDGSLWATNKTEFVKIDPRSLSVSRITLDKNMSVYYDDALSVYRPATLAASLNDNALYFVSALGSGWSMTGRDIMKFDIASQKVTPFFMAPAKNLIVYGSALSVCPKTGNLYAIYTEEGWGNHYLNTAIYAIDTKTGKQIEKIPYTKENETVYWFPTRILFPSK
ncbi:MAG: DUF5074 domain-containing protein [Bacteroidia bacterium]|nr:DUF5074 domain-containing protein [Bacteroidia bacterium]